MPQSEATVIGGELDYQEHDFQRIRAMIFARAGIHLHDGKRAMVFNRLSKRLRLTGHRRFCDYLDQLDRAATAPEWEFFTNALTTNLSGFFREAHHFDVLAQWLQALSPQTNCTIWSCAAASGEEAYSIAMTADSALPNATQRIRIVASDINTQTLARAREGIYPASKVQSLEPEFLKNYFQKGTGVHTGQVRIQPWLVDWVTFAQINLQEPRWPSQVAQVDAIFCRNVLIYFQESTQRLVLEKLHQALTPAGHLFMGHAEHLGKHEDLFTPIGKTVYVKR
ncbi:chemotaxis protein CheR [Lampropedia puyangensis]|uniref:Chemotaxis protein methyltransferase n=2 Tax=Lampropedia puyangensis TaxID=1330072 RepID=A0A4S8EVY2_9BURK|nr:chemotaxis protein CheR [Lampropedia puyangensis]